MAIATALALAATAPAAAHAAYTVSYSSSTGLLVQGDAASDGATVALRESPRRYRVRPVSRTNLQGDNIPAATLVLGSGCTLVTEDGITEANCPAPGSIVVTGNLGDSPDFLSGSTPGTPGDMFVDGGAGNDVVSGGSGFDALDGAAGNDDLAGFGGNDALEGGDGNDRFTGDGSGGGGTDTVLGEGGNDTFRAMPSSVSPDLFNGGAGVDVGDYGLRNARLHLTTNIGQADDPNDGAFLEGDDLDSVETLIGGGGNDLLQVQYVSGQRFPPLVLGTRTLTGNGGSDDLRVRGFLQSSLDGGLGTDSVSGGDRTDTIFSRDGEADGVTCGGGNDSLNADLRDEPVSTSCETVDQGAVEEGPNVIVRSRSVRVGRNGSLSVRLACPRRLQHTCTGTLAARVDKRRRRFGRRTRYSIRRGRSASVEAKLPAAQRAPARRRRARVRLRSVERGKHGPKTTLRSLPARRR